MAEHDESFKVEEEKYIFFSFAEQNFCVCGNGDVIAKKLMFACKC